MLSTSIQIATIAAKSLIGGIVGYFTNDLAIQMLFKKRFGMGGVVIQTRMEFIENATDLVEEEVLTTEVLQAEIEKEAFKKALFPIIDDFIRIHLPATSARPPKAMIGLLACCCNMRSLPFSKSSGIWPGRSNSANWYPKNRRSTSPGYPPGTFWIFCKTENVLKGSC